MASQTPPNPPAQVFTRKMVKVKSVSGSQIDLLHQREKVFYEAARDKYLDENVFTAASDLRGIDRLLLFETQVYRWQWMLAANMDYDGVDLEASEVTELRRSIKDTENLISQLQNDLGLTKAQRDKSASAESVGDYIKNLQQRAKEHGVKRDAEIGKAIELLNECSTIAGSYKRSNESERRKLGFESAEDVVDWIVEVMVPQFRDIDAKYRAGQQKFWIRSL